MTISSPYIKRFRRWSRRSGGALIALLTSYFVLAYILVPMIWRHEERHPALDTAPKTTVTAAGIPGDALNIGLVGTRADVIQAMLAAGWSPADPITFRSSAAIAASVLFDRPYPDAPVSTLYLFGRAQDLTFERPSGSSADQRHHVRFWRSDTLDSDGVPLWLGAATFDRGVGFSHDTGQITHHIAPNIDAERDTLIQDLTGADTISRTYQATGVGPTSDGRNGGGDRYETDGEMTVGVLKRAE